MRVLLIAPPPLATAGNERAVRRIATGLARRGHDVVRVDATEGGAPRGGTCEGSFDVVHVYHAFRAATPRDFAGPHGRAARVVTFAGSDLPGLPLARERAAVIAGEVARADAAMVPLEEQRKALEAAWPGLRGRVRVVPKGVVPPRGSFPLRARIAVEEDAPLALLPAGIRRVKGQRRALEWFAGVVAAEPRARLVMVGAEIEPDEARWLRHALAALTWAHWLGALAPDAMGGAYAAADAVLNTSDYEGLSNALLEALALGRPVVAHAAPGNREWLRDGEQALLFRDRAEFTAKVLACLRREPGALEAAARGPGWIAAHHDPEREIDGVEALYRLAIDHAAGRATS